MGKPNILCLRHCSYILPYNPGILIIGLNSKVSQNINPTLSLL